MIAFVWLISIAIALPILAGLNDTADRVANQCAFNNEKFLVYSSVISFYIPTTVMIILYYRIFRVIRSRAKIAKLRNASTKSNFLLAEKKLTVLSTMAKKRTANKHASTHSDLAKQISINDKNNTDNILPSLQKDANNNDPAKDVNFVSAGIFKLKNSPAKTIKPATNVEVNEKCQTKETNVDETRRNNNNDFAKSGGDEKIVPLLNNGKEDACVSPKSTKKLDKKSNVKALTPSSKPKFQSIVNQASSNKEKRVTKTLAIVVIVFLVCW